MTNCRAISTIATSHLSFAKIIAKISSDAHYAITQCTHKVDVVAKRATKVDLVKTNLVDWNCLPETWNTLEMPAIMTIWSTSCITSPIYSVKVNDKITGYIGSTEYGNWHPIGLVLELQRKDIQENCIVYGWVI